jgi:hypothetical protein
MKESMMKRGLLVLATSVSFGLFGGCDTSNDKSRTVERTPVAAPASALPAPANAKLLMRVSAKGDQIYAPKASAEAGKFEWGPATPDAKLFDAAGREVGTHGKGPHWTLADGGKVIAQLPPTKKVSVDPAAVPWLELGVKDGSAAASLKDVTIIQRVKTTGGLPSTQPPTSADAKEVRVPYTAEYLFFTRG